MPEIIAGDDFPTIKFVAKFAGIGMLGGLLASVAAHVIAGFSFYLEASAIGANLRFEPTPSTAALAPRGSSARR